MRNRCILILVILVSCSSPLPKDVLPPEQMKIVLWDFMRADEMAALNITSDTSLNQLQTYGGYYQDILNIHKITRENFKKSLLYYQSHPALFKVVLDSLQNYADRKQKEDSSHPVKPSHPVSIPQPMPIPIKISIDSLKKRRPK